METWLRLIQSDLEKLTRYPYRSLSSVSISGCRMTTNLTVPGTDFSPQQPSWEMGIPPRSGMSNGLGFSQAPAPSSSG
jgi:hypothetical protein